MRFILPFNIWLIIFFAGCQDKTQPIQSLEIEEYHITLHQQLGGLYHDFPELYIYIDDVFAGAPGIPIRIPFQTRNQNPKIVVFPGIRENGIFQSPLIYPFLDKYETTVDLSLDNVVRVTPQFTYKNKIKIRLIDPFEGETSFTNILSGDSSFQWQFSHQEKIEGESSGELILSPGQGSIELSTLKKFRKLPQDGSSVFLELNYKNEIPFTIGLIGYNPGLPPTKNYKLALRPRENWNKIYINFTPEIQLSQLTEYDIILRVEKESPEQESRIYLDNLKFLHL